VALIAIFSSCNPTQISQEDRQKVFLLEKSLIRQKKAEGFAERDKIAILSVFFLRRGTRLQFSVHFALPLIFAEPASFCLSFYFGFQAVHN
jgi:hypothetical protein